MPNPPFPAPAHRALCGTRLDNALPLSGLTPQYSLPPTCFNEVVLVPLASWIFLAALLGCGLFLARSASASRSKARSARAPSASDPEGKGPSASEEGQDEGGLPSQTALVSPAEPAWAPPLQRYNRKRRTGSGSWPRTRNAAAVVYTLLLVAALLMSEYSPIHALRPLFHSTAMLAGLPASPRQAELSSSLTPFRSFQTRTHAQTSSKSSA